MNGKYDLTVGNEFKKLIRFAMPYLLAVFLQTFYGITDLFVIGLYNGSSTTTAVSIGSQVMHMLTVIVCGFAMGTTVQIGRCVGAKNYSEARKQVGNSITFFGIVTIIATLVLLSASSGITQLMHTPTEAIEETQAYLMICFAGIPFVVAYNVISSIFRGMGDSKRPMYFVAVACIFNVILDFVFIGGMRLGAGGAALATILGQAISVAVSLLALKKIKFGFDLHRENLRIEKEVLAKILKVGAPIALQDGLIQVAFIVITIIANSRGLTDATAVGIVEKLICFMFLVPSAFLSAISAFTAQNMGAGKEKRAKKSLYYGLMITAFWGFLCVVYCQFRPEGLVSLFTKDVSVLAAGCTYLMSYAFDTFFAAFHFCFSGYFCGCQKSTISFIHNMISIVLIRVPGAALLSKMWADTLYPMGWAAPMGSLLSAMICFGFFVYLQKKPQAT